MKFNRRGQVGLGSVIVFIALIIGVTVWAGMMYQEGNQAKEAAKTTGKSSQQQIRTQVNPVSAEAAIDRDGNYTHLKVLVEIPPASDPINLDSLMLKLQSGRYNLPLVFRGEDGEVNNSDDGYITHTEEEDSGPDSQEIGDIGVYREEEHDNITTSYVNLSTVDFDLDGVDDRVKLCSNKGSCPQNNDGKHLLFNLSTGGNIYILMTNETGGAIGSICKFKDGNNVVDMNMTPIGTYGYLNFSGTLCEDCCIIEDSVSNLTYYQKETPLYNDLDDDGDASDYLYVNTTHAMFFYTSYGKKVAPFNTSIATPTTLNVTTQLTHGGEPFADIRINGTTQYDNIIDAPVTFRISDYINSTLTDSYYVTEFIEKESGSGEGTLGDGDLARLHLELPTSITEPTTLRFLPQTGMPTTIRLSPPIAPSGDAVALYP